jgi:hypothetical protein
MSFKVSIIRGSVNILIDDDLPETDITDLLEFDETQLEDLYQHHAAIQSRWEQIAINLKNQLELFNDEFVAKWWAHNKSFAKFVLMSYGETKPTVDAIKDMTILIYSSDTTDTEKDKYCEFAFNFASKKDLGIDTGAKDDFYKRMYRYLIQDPSWNYETLVHTYQSLQKNYETIANIAKRLDSRSYHMKELKELVMAKSSNMGPMSCRDENRKRDLISQISRTR